MANPGLEMTDTPLLNAAAEAPGGLQARRRWFHSWRCCLPALGCLDNPEQRRKALVEKNGSYRVHADGLWGHRSKFFSDMYITLIDLEWRYVMLNLFATFFITFMFFGFLWWLMGFVNGDFENLHKPDHEFCLRGITSFAGVILFSMETQTTIGYGVAFPNPHCTATVPLLFLQVTVGLFLQTFMLGAIFVKIARPKYRANTILYSSHAVINQENGKLVLQVRVGDVRKSHLVGASITGMVIRGFACDDGVYNPLYQHRCEFTANNMADRMCLLWPVIVTHVIDKDSPLYDIGPTDSATDRNFEVILYLSGSVESTGETCQARTSYIASEILWGHRFQEIEEFDSVQGRWRINFSGFNDTVSDKKIVHSAKELDVIQADRVHADAIQADKAHPSAIQTDKVHSAAIKRDKVHPVAIQTDKVLPGAIQTDKVLSGAIQTDKAHPAAIQTNKVHTVVIQAGKVHKIGCHLDEGETVVESTVVGKVLHPA